MKKGASVLGAELTESVAVSSLESDVYVSFIIPIVTFKITYLLITYHQGQGTDSNSARRKRQSGPPSIDDLGDVPSTVDTENEFVKTFTGVSRKGLMFKDSSI